MHRRGREMICAAALGPCCRAGGHRQALAWEARQRGPSPTTRPFRDCKVMTMYVCRLKKAPTVSCWPSARAVSPQANT